MISTKQVRYVSISLLLAILGLFLILATSCSTSKHIHKGQLANGEIDKNEYFYLVQSLNELNPTK